MSISRCKTVLWQSCVLAWIIITSNHVLISRRRRQSCYTGLPLRCPGSLEIKWQFAVCLVPLCASCLAVCWLCAELAGQFVMTAYNFYSVSSHIQHNEAMWPVACIDWRWSHRLQRKRPILITGSMWQSHTPTGLHINHSTKLTNTCLLLHGHYDANVEKARLC